MVKTTKNFMNLLYGNRKTNCRRVAPGGKIWKYFIGSIRILIFHTLWFFGNKLIFTSAIKNIIPNFNVKRCEYYINYIFNNNLIYLYLYS